MTARARGTSGGGGHEEVARASRVGRGRGGARRWPGRASRGAHRVANVDGEPGGAARRVEREDGAREHGEGGHVEGLEHDLAHLLARGGRRVELASTRRESARRTFRSRASMGGELAMLRCALSGSHQVSPGFMKSSDSMRSFSEVEGCDAMTKRFHPESPLL